MAKKSNQNEAETLVKRGGRPLGTYPTELGFLLLTTKSLNCIIPSLPEGSFFMPSPSELGSFFNSFPNTEHVKTVCKAAQGAEKCRYLSHSISLTGTQNYCRKGSEYEREKIDKQVAQGDIEARGDNCPGTLGFVIDNQGLLMGNRTVHHEVGEAYEGTFTGIHQINRIIEVAGIGSTEQSVDVSISQEGIVFSARYIGFATIFFDKPQEAKK